MDRVVRRLDGLASDIDDEKSFALPMYRSKLMPTVFRPLCYAL